MEIPYIINIQKYSIHDGDGIRTTIFFKGCQMSCTWCHNPESQSFHKELMYNNDKCGRCGVCETVCPQKAIQITAESVISDRSKCIVCGACADSCVNNAREIVGEQYTISQLTKLAEQDKLFYETSNGGITLSGGEVMLQNPDYIEELVRKLKRKGYNIAVDTCGYAPYRNFERILPYVDTFLYDIKLIDTNKHERYMGKSNELILDNLKKLSSSGANIQIRIPVIEGVNSSDEDIGAIIEFLKKGIHVKKINLLPYHNTGKDKYERIGLCYRGGNFQKPSDERMEQLAEKFHAAGFSQIKIGG